MGQGHRRPTQTGKPVQPAAKAAPTFIKHAPSATIKGAVSAAAAHVKKANAAAKRK